MILTSNGKIYYVESKEGQCVIKLIDPDDDEKDE